VGGLGCGCRGGGGKAQRVFFGYKFGGGRLGDRVGRADVVCENKRGEGRDGVGIERLARTREM